MRAREFELFAEEVRQRHPRFDEPGYGRAIDDEGDRKTLTEILSRLDEEGAAER